MKEISHEMILERGKYEDLNIDGVDADLVKGVYRFMVRLRKTQEALIDEYHPADEIRCPVHFCIGQEAVPAALSFVVEEDDFMLSSHRSHGYFFAKGGSMQALFAELYGRATGTNGGLAGSQEISAADIKFFAGAIISGTAAIADGAALGLRFKEYPSIVFASFGDAATEEGAFWESISYAVLRKLPVVFICENNRYSTYSPQYKRQAADDIRKRVEAFGVTSRSLFGNDVIAVYRVLREAADHVRRGKGPFFVEAYTYRWNGHVGPEDDDYVGYRPKSELEFWRSNCPIALLEEKMLTAGLLTEDTKRNINAEIDAEIFQAFTFAKQSPFPENSNWEKLNYNDNTPLADRLLHDHTQSEVFDHNQTETMPQPY